MTSMSHGAKLEWFTSFGTRDSYAQIGNGVYRVGCGIFYTLHPAANIINRNFWRRYNRGKKRTSPSHARFLRRQRLQAAIKLDASAARLALRHAAGGHYV